MHVDQQRRSALRVRCFHQPAVDALPAALAVGHLEAAQLRAQRCALVEPAIEAAERALLRALPVAAIQGVGLRRRQGAVDEPIVRRAERAHLAFAGDDAPQFAAGHLHGHHFLHAAGRHDEGELRAVGGPHHGLERHHFDGFVAERAHLALRHVHAPQPHLRVARLDIAGEDEVAPVGRPGG